MSDIKCVRTGETYKLACAFHDKCTAECSLKFYCPAAGEERFILTMNRITFFIWYTVRLTIEGFTFLACCRGGAVQDDDQRVHILQLSMDCDV